MCWLIWTLEGQVVIVLDASAAVFALLNNGEARKRLAGEHVAVPHLIDSELANALRGQVLGGKIGAEDVDRALTRWSRLGLRRHAGVGLLPRIWELRHNFTASDSTYIALAETLGCDLVTADARLASAPTPRCPVVVVHR